MKSFLLFVAFTVSWQLSAQSVLDLKLSSLQKTDQDIVSLLKEIENSQSVKFYFIPEWFSGIEFTPNSDSLVLRELLYSGLLNSDISFFELNPNTIVFVKDPTQALRHLNNLKGVQRIQQNIDKATFGLSVKNGKAEAVLRGKVLDNKSKEPLVGVSISVDNAAYGTTTDPDGFFKLTLPVGAHLVKCSYVNYDDKYFDLEIYEDGEVNWFIEERPTLLDEIVIQDRAAREITTSTIGVAQLDMKEMKRAPALLGEVDLIKAIQVLPGVTSVGEAASGFNVRGGSVDQNLILYDGLPVFNSSHVFGFFSAFNSEAVRDVTFYRGGIPADFGGRISSVLDIRSKEGSYEKWNASGGIGIISSNLLVNGPIKKDKTAIAMSLRSTYSDWLINSVRSNYVNLENSTVKFYDGSFKLTHKFSDKSKLTLSAYSSHDEFKLQGDSIFSWDSQLASVRWDKEINSNLSAVLVLGAGNYRYDVVDEDPNRGFNLSYSILYPSIKGELHYKWNKHKGTVGAHGTLYNFNPGLLEPSGPASNAIRIAMDKQFSRESALYLTDQFQVNNKLFVDIGLRASFFQSMGPGSLTLYESGKPRETLSITDTISFSRNETIKSFFNPEPRVGLRYEISPETSLKFGYNRMVQYLHLVTNTTAVTPVDIWQPSGYYFKPQIADQVSFGLFTQFKDKLYESFVEVYYKKVDNVLDFKDGAELILNSQIETDLLQGSAKAYGAEFQITKVKGRLEGSFSYTYSKSLRTISGNSDEETINGGREYDSNFDQPHVVNLNWKYNITKRYFFTGGFTYRTGRPITLPLTAFAIENYTVTTFSDRNEYRVPDYHRLDVGLVIEGNHKRKKFWDGTWTISVYNIYARKNPYSVFFKEVRPGILRPYRLAIIGTALPSISYSFKI